MPDLSTEARARVEAAVERLSDGHRFGCLANAGLLDECTCGAPAARAALLATVEAVVGEAVAAASEDTARMDVLEREAMTEPLVLHDGRQDDIGGLRGLGLMPGLLRRSLREAIDQAFRPAARPSAPEVGP